MSTSPAATPAPRLAARTARLQPSPIREILSVIDRPGMISFAGGLPAADTFPAFGVDRLPAACLQYGASEGDPALRERVAAMLRHRGLDCDPAQVLILSGSQQGIDLVAKAFVEPGTPVAVEAPTYLAALQVFRLFGARLVEIDAAGDCGQALMRERPPLAYLIPTFNNPTGRCLDEAGRDALARACDAAGSTLFEDDPYCDLAFDPCARRPVCARLRRTSWVYQGSFSKSLAPGLRLGFLVASPDLLPVLTRLKQAADLHSSRVSQRLVLDRLDDPGEPERMRALVARYRDARDLFDAGLRRHFGAVATWNTPPGGLFFWVALRRRMDTRTLLPRAIERGVAFMPGEFFYPDDAPARGLMRLNFSHADPRQVESGLATLAALIGEA